MRIRRGVECSSGWKGMDVVSPERLLKGTDI